MNINKLRFDCSKIDRKWLVGITEFNGEFVVKCSSYENVSSFLLNLTFYYFVVFPVEDIQTAYKFKSFFKVGKVVFNNSYCYYFVTNIDHHYKRIMRFFNGSKLLSKKRINYERYRYMLFKTYNGVIDELNYEYIRKYMCRYVVTNNSKLDELLAIVDQKLTVAIIKGSFYFNFRLFIYFIVLCLLKIKSED